MQVKKILIIMLVKYVSIDGIPQASLFFRFVDIIVITVHDRYWDVENNSLCVYVRYAYTE
jgi:hypothetical protein